MENNIASNQRELSKHAVLMSSKGQEENSPGMDPADMLGDTTRTEIAKASFLSPEDKRALGVRPE